MLGTEVLVKGPCGMRTLRLAPTRKARPKSKPSFSRHTTLHDLPLPKSSRKPLIAETRRLNHASSRTHNLSTVLSHLIHQTSRTLIPDTHNFRNRRNSTTPRANRDKNNQRPTNLETIYRLRLFRLRRLRPIQHHIVKERPQSSASHKVPREIEFHSHIQAHIAHIVRNFVFRQHRWFPNGPYTRHVDVHAFVRGLINTEDDAHRGEAGERTYRAGG